MKSIKFSFIICLFGFIHFALAANKEPMTAIKQCVNENPRLVDRSEFEEDGHLFTTLAIAELAKFSDQRMVTLSYYSQYPDIEKKYNAVPVSLKYLLIPWKWTWRNDITGALHSLHGGKRKQIDQRRHSIRQALSETIIKPELDWLSGLLIHAFADSYAHTKHNYNSKKEKAYNVWIGHAIPSIFRDSPDCIAANKPKYIGYVNDLYNVLKSDTSNDIDFNLFIDEVRNLKLNGESCPKFNRIIDDVDSRMGKIKDCMRKESRMLTKSEIQHAINLIK